MNLRPYIDRPQKPREPAQVEPRFGQDPVEAAGRNQSQPGGMEDGATRLTRLVEHQSFQSAEILRSLAAIAAALIHDKDKSDMRRMHEQLENIGVRLRRVEETMAKLTATVSGAAQPPARPAYPRSDASQTPPPRVADARASDPSGGFNAAYRNLATEGQIDHPDEVRTTIEAIAREQGLPRDSRAEALVKATFSVLPKALNRWSATALQTFVAHLLGPSSLLIRPKIGDVLDLQAHNDCSTEVTGTRGRVREVIFPGVRQGERVLVRALVQT